MAQVFAGRRQKCIGILREVKNKWERRSPLTPTAVSKLTKKGVRVLVQPSNMRIFRDSEFKAAGAEISEDLSESNTIFGVKEFPHSQMIKNKSYILFSHVIKAQPYNMPFLDACLANNIRLFDYETIRATPQNGGQRLVAFGKFAGLAGMIDMLRGLGERLLSLGYSTPFMSVASSYMYPDLPTAKAAVQRCGEEIKRLGTGLPADMPPLRFVFTGTGNVAGGALEIFNLLPVKWVTPEQLSTLPADPFTLYACVAQAKDMVQRKDGGAFDKKEYYENPQLYRPTFHETIAPHMSVLVNCMYWDVRFPRLLTNAQTKELEATYKDQKRRTFLGLADITCDIQGSVEFLKRHCTIDQPFFMYDPTKDTIQNSIEGPGVIVLGIENLPAEFPRDASEHFSSCLEQFAEPLSLSDHSKPFSTAQEYLPPEIYNSCIAADGKLTPPFEYIAKLRSARTASTAPTSAAATGVTAATAPVATTGAVPSEFAPTPLTLSPVGGILRPIMVEGHLFDTGFINQVLDVLEEQALDFQVLHWLISPNRSNRNNNLSRAVIMLKVTDEKQLKSILDHISVLASRMPIAKAKASEMAPDVASAYTTPSTPSSSTEAGTLAAGPGAAASGRFFNSAVVQEPKSGKRVLVLGSGFVAGPAVQQLVKAGHEVIVASNNETEATKLVEPYSPHASFVELDVSDLASVSRLVSGSDLVMSLLPAAMHLPVAKLCLEHSKDLVTASYVSPGMKEMHDAAKQKGLTFLNELGLDPGLDHLSAMKLMDEVKAHHKGARILSFRSLCGGLPAPDCANNPFNYKFSWSPWGMLVATQNKAIYRDDGKLVEIPSDKLLLSAQSYAGLSAFNLEYYANRDSLSYTGLYGLEDANTMFRGTLRYAGTAALLDGYAKLGLMSRDAVPIKAHDWCTFLCDRFNTSPSSLNDAIYMQLYRARVPMETADRVLQSLQWLGCFGPESLWRNAALKQKREKENGVVSPLELLCALMQDKLTYAPGERDCVVMVHDFAIALGPQDDAPIQKRRSSLISFGGDGGHQLNFQTGGGGGPRGYSAMARTVGIPAALGANMILAGALKGRGVVVPTTKDIYTPILKQLEREGIIFREEILS